MGNAGQMKQLRMISCLSLICFLFLSSAYADEKDHSINRYYTCLMGAGNSHIGWGETTEKVDTADFYFRYCREVKPNIGKSWYKANHELWIEIPLMTTLEPELEIMISLVYNFALVSKSSRDYEPYMFVGGGPLYTTASIPGMGSKFCGNYQAGLGIRFPINDNMLLNIESRYHHISNGDFWDPNVPINSTKFHMGFSYLF